MGFKDNYYSAAALIKSWINSSDLKRVEVNKAAREDMRYSSKKNGVYYIDVLPEEFEEAVKAANEVNEEIQRRREEKQRPIEVPIIKKPNNINKGYTEEDLDRFAKIYEYKPRTYEKKKRYTFKDNIKDKVKHVKENIKDKVKHVKENIKNKPNKDLKGKFKNFGKKVKELSGTKPIKIIEGLSIGILVLLLAKGIYITAHQKIEAYIARAAETSLSTVKGEFGADAIYNKSTITGSNSAIDWKRVIIDGKAYDYKARIEDGKTKVLKNDGLGIEERNAIAIVAAAQNGNYWDAKKANELVAEIKNGQVNLFVDTRSNGNAEQEIGD